MINLVGNLVIDINKQMSMHIVKVYALTSVIIAIIICYIIIKQYRKNQVFSGTKIYRGNRYRMKVYVGTIIPSIESHKRDIHGVIVCIDQERYTKHMNAEECRPIAINDFIEECILKYDEFLKKQVPGEGISKKRRKDIQRDLKR